MVFIMISLWHEEVKPYPSVNKYANDALAILKNSTNFDGRKAMKTFLIPQIHLPFFMSRIGQKIPESIICYHCNCRPKEEWRQI